MTARPSGPDAGAPTGRAPLFLVHDETGSAEYARSLTRRLSAATTVFALPGPLRAEPGLRTVEGMASRLARAVLDVQPRGPYRIAGWSFGAILAYEVAAQLLGRDESVRLLACIHRPGRPAGAASAGARDAGDELARGWGTTAARAMGFAAPGAGPRDTSLLPRQVAPAELRGRLDARRTCLRAAARYAPPPLPVTVDLFTAEGAADAGPWREWGVAEPGAAIRRILVPASASLPRVPEPRALAGALARETGRAGEPAGAEPEERPSPVVALRFRGSGTPLFCIPGAGASVVGLAELAACLPPGSPVYGLEPRGMDGASVPHATAAAAADHYLAAVAEAAGARPVHLLGHSFGGRVALEMALRLLAAGRPAASLTLVDSSAPDPEGPAVREHDAVEAFLAFVEVLELAAERSLGIDPARIATLDEDARLRLLHGRMARLGQLPARSAPAMLAGPFRVFSACLRAPHRPGAVYPRPAHLVLLRDGRLDPEADERRMSEAARAWRRWLPEARVSVGPGNHMTALRRPHVERLAALLSPGE